MWQRPTFPYQTGIVSSAMRGLTSGFGMEPGISLSLKLPIGKKKASPRNNLGEALSGVIMLADI